MIAISVEVAVVGTANVDLVLHVPRLPAAGETVFASPLRTLPGGKGLNQAIAVARFGGNSALVARIGDDAWGQLLLDALIAAGVDVAATARPADSTTAAAIVHVPPGGDSAVVLARCPDCLPTVPDIEAAAAVLTDAAVTVVQLELPVEVVDRSTTLATGEIIGSLAPQVPLPAAILRRLDVLVVNAAEAATMLAATSRSVTDRPVEAARALTLMGPTTVVVTLGAAGAAYASGEVGGTAPAPAVTVADTTGAGDAALGAFALARARRRPLPEAVAAAVEAGSTAVQQPGAALVPNPPATPTA
jgi:ribokinase